jgi:hypothetical protein
MKQKSVARNQLNELNQLNQFIEFVTAREANLTQFEYSVRFSSERPHLQTKRFN